MSTSVTSISPTALPRAEPGHKTVRAIDLAPLAADAPAAGAERARALLKEVHPLHQIKTQVQVCVGQAQVTVGELINAKEGQVLKLDRQVDQAIDLLIEGRVVARGYLVALDGQFAVRISQLPQPLTLAP